MEILKKRRGSGIPLSLSSFFPLVGMLEELRESSRRDGRSHGLEPTQSASEEEDDCPPVLRRAITSVQHSERREPPSYLEAKRAVGRGDSPGGSGRLGRRNSLQLELYSSVGAYENKISDDARDVLLKVQTRARPDRRIPRSAAAWRLYVDTYSRKTRQRQEVCMAQVLSADLSAAILPRGSFGSGTVSPNAGIRSARDHSGIADFASDGSDGEEARQSELEARAARNAMAIQHAGMIVRQVLSWALPCLQPVASLSCAASVPTQTAHCWIRHRR